MKKAFYNNIEKIQLRQFNSFLKTVIYSFFVLNTV